MSLMDNITADKSVIPEYASISESVYFIMESIEQEYNNLLQKLALAELGIYSTTGQEVVYEGTILDETKAKINTFITGSWAKTKGMYDKFLEEVKSNTQKANDKIPTKKIKARVINTVGEIQDAEYAKSYPYTGLEAAKTGSGVVWSAVSSLVNSAAGVTSENEDSIKATFAKAIGAESGSTKHIKNAIIKNFQGADSKSFAIGKSAVSSNISELWDSVFDYKKISGEIKKAYAVTKGAFDKLAKDNKAFKTEDDLKARLKFYKFVAEVIVITANAVCTIYKEQLATNRKVVWKVVAQNLKASKKAAPVKEAMTEEYMDMEEEHVDLDPAEELYMREGYMEESEEGSLFGNWDLD